MPRWRRSTPAASDASTERLAWRSVALLRPDDAVAPECVWGSGLRRALGAERQRCSHLGLLGAAGLHATECTQAQTLSPRAVAGSRFGLGHVERGLRFLREAQQLDLAQARTTSVHQLPARDTSSQAGWSRRGARSVTRGEVAEQRAGTRRATPAAQLDAS